MSEIKTQLKSIVTEKMIPESEMYLSEIHQLLEDKTASQDDMDAIKEMEGFLVELQNIVEAIDQNEMSDDDAQLIYNKILELLEEHAHE
jgi:hypothetical protein